MLFQFNIIGKEQQQKASSISCLQSFTYFWEGFWDKVRLENAEGDDAGAKGFLGGFLAMKMDRAKTLQGGPTSLRDTFE